MSRNYNTESEKFDQGLRERTEDLASKVKDKANRAGNAISDTIDRRRGTAADGLDRFAETIHAKAGSVPGGARMERAAHSVANGIETTASYLRDHRVSEMKDDLVSACRKHPAQALVSALVIGFVIGRVARR
jgi:hypothetical protein